LKTLSSSFIFQSKNLVGCDELGTRLLQNRQGDTA